MKNKTILILLVFSTLILSATIVLAADPVCNSVTYCDSTVTLSAQKAPIFADGTGDWLNSFERYFTLEVTYGDGLTTAVDGDPKLTYSCSLDGLSFDSCQTGAFIEPGEYILRVTVEDDPSLFYLGKYQDTTLKILAEGTPIKSDMFPGGDNLADSPADGKGLTVTYFADGAVSGSAVEDWNTYQVGDEAVLLGNLGMDRTGNPDPMVNPGYQLTGWRSVKDKTETYAIGDSIVMTENLTLLPIWTPEGEIDANAPAGVATKAAAPSLSPADAAALSAKGITFFPVRNDGAATAPVLVVGSKIYENSTTTAKSADSEPDAASSRVLDGFYTSSGEPMRVVLGQRGGDSVSEANGLSDVKAPVEETVVDEEPIAEDPVVAVSMSEALVDEEPVVNEPVVETSVEEPFINEEPDLETPVFAALEGEALGNENAVVEGPVVEIPVEETLVNEEPVVKDDAVESPVLTDSMTSVGAETPDADTPFVAAVANVAPAVTETESEAPALVAKQLPSQPTYYRAPEADLANFTVGLPNTGMATRDMGAIPEDVIAAELISVGMTLELPLYHVVSEIVVVPFTGTSWEVAALGGRVGLLEGFDVPGTGVSLLAAHNHLNAEETGPFLMIGGMKAGDRLFVRSQDGSLMTFEVYDNVLIEPNDFATIETLTNEVSGALVLITCENETIDGGYLDRRVVFAKPV